MRCENTTRDLSTCFDGIGARVTRCRRQAAWAIFVNPPRDNDDGKRRLCDFCNKHNYTGFRRERMRPSMTHHPKGGNAMSIIPPKSPKGDGWIDRGPTPPEFTMGYEGRSWYYPEQGLLVISAVEVASDPGDIDKGPEYHVSVSKSTGRCSRNEARFVLKAFDMLDADEDNHVPYGKVRNFWKPVAEQLVGHVCPCKDDEPAIVEDKGDYVWRGIT